MRNRGVRRDSGKKKQQERANNTKKQEQQQSSQNSSNIDEIIRKYKTELKEKLDVNTNPVMSRRVFSQDYQEFKKQYLPTSMTFYEKMCNAAAFLNVSPDEKTKDILNKDLGTAHLSVTPEGVYSAAILYPMIATFIVALVTFVLFREFLGYIPFYLIIFGFSIYVMLQLPGNFANTIRLKASNQMVQSIFYVVSFMRHTSNLELAVEFASDRIDPPLALDLKKVLWDVESGKYENVKESLDYYLEGWRKTNLEFVESFHLIEGSLYEPTEDRRVGMLDKALKVMLDETYEKMLHFAQELKGPINMLYMLGIILPILSLVILPLVGSMMTNDSLTPAKLSFGIFLLYNVTLPMIVFIQGRQVLSKRPTGYGDSDISDTNPELKKLKKLNILGFRLNPLYIALIIIGVGLLIGFSPLIIKPAIVDPSSANITAAHDWTIVHGTDYRFWGYKVKPCTQDGCTGNYVVGPYGIGSTALSTIMILMIGMGIGFYFYSRNKNLYKIRERSKELEKEFSSALFQLGNRLGDGVPAELAFEKAATVVKGTVSGNFFTTVALNIRRLGMSVQDAIFNPRRGALNYFPSPLIESTMRVLIESIKKGPLIASQALINVSEYIREIHRVNERLRDLLADVISDMKQQISILAPAIAGIVVGITAMIGTILNELTKLFSQFTTTGVGQLGGSDAVASAGGNLDVLKGLFHDAIPTYYFQIIVGLYVVEITIVLTIILNGVENGSDKLFERYLIGKNLLRTTMLYFIISLTTSLLFSYIAAQILPAAVG